MGRANPFINSLNTGEVSELIESRSDLTKYASACKTLENAFPLVEGGAKKMPGTYYAGIAANGGPLGTATTGKSRLVPFQFSTNQNAILEFYAQGMRIWMNGGLVEVLGVPVVVTTPYAEADLFDLDISTQSADVIYILHTGYPPASINRVSDTEWTYTPLSLYGTEDVVKVGYSALGQPISAISKANPAVVTLASASSVNPFTSGQRIYINECSGMVELNQGQFTVDSPGGAAGAWTIRLLPLTANGTGPVGTVAGGGGSFSSDPSGTYVATGGTGTGLTITAVGEHLYGSLWVISSVHVGSAGSGYTKGDTVTITVHAQPIQCYVESLQGSGLIDSTNFLDYTGGGFVVAAPSLFNAAGDYPACATLYQQRFCLSGSLNNPTRMNGSVQGDYPDFICDPNDTSYAIQFDLVSQQINPVRWMIGSPNALLLGTAGGVWTMFTTDGLSLSQTDVTAALQTTIGVGNVAPQLVNSDVIWISRTTQVVRLLIFNWMTNQWQGPDLTRLNRQIAVGPTKATSGLTQTAFQREPYPIFWATRRDGQLIGLTYERDEEVFAWFRVVTDGVIESVACVSSDNDEDQVWISVKRTVNGVDQRYIEYFKPQGIYSDLANAFFVHCGLQWDGGAAATITNITRANPPIVTATAHGFSTGYHVQIMGVEGMTEINQEPTQAYTITVIDADHFSLDGMDTTGFSAYTAGGEAAHVTNEVTGLQYLASKNAVAVGDGAQIWTGTIPTSGAVSFGYYANLITIGLPFTTTIEPMNPMIGNQQMTSKGHRQKISRATFSLYESIGGQYGTDTDHLYDMLYGTGDSGSAPSLFTGEVTLDLDGEWSDEDTIVIQHSDPFPFTLRSVAPRIDVAEAG